jgi:hypothetical protein
MGLGLEDGLDHDVIARAISQWDDEKNLSGLSKP